MTVNAKRFGLRESTRAQHERLDAEVGDFSDRASYIRYLKGISGFRLVVEEALGVTAFPDCFGSWRPTFVADHLLRDLSDLGLTPADPLADFHVPRDVSGLLGVVYVLEGSSLGARLLVKRAASLGFHENHGARHLAAQTARPESWAGFQSILENTASFDERIGSEAANRTFDAALAAFKVGNLELIG